MAPLWGSFQAGEGSTGWRKESNKQEKRCTKAEAGAGLACSWNGEKTMQLP